MVTSRSKAKERKASPLISIIAIMVTSASETDFSRPSFNMINMMMTAAKPTVTI